MNLDALRDRIDLARETIRQDEARGYRHMINLDLLDNSERLLAVAEAAQETLAVALHAAGSPGDGTGPEAVIECEVIWNLLHGPLDALEVG